MSADGCRHHWLIQSPHDGPTSRGVCKLCHAVRDFPNSPPERWWRGHREGQELPMFLTENALNQWWRRGAGPSPGVHPHLGLRGERLGSLAATDEEIG